MQKILSLAALLLSSGIAAAQTDPLRYSVSFPNAVHHEAQVELFIPDAPAGTLTVRVSRSSPGRYATHEFGKNIYHVRAFDQAGKELPVRQVRGDVYEITGHGKDVKVTYTVFGNHTDGTYLEVDETHAHINMPATFLWSPQLTDRPVRVRFRDLDKRGWKVATQLQPTDREDEFAAPSFQYFMDSPAELSAFKLVAWTDTGSDGKKQEIRLASHTADSDEVVKAFAGQVGRMTREMKAVFGELPVFDFGTYTFLQDVHPDNNGDGMEHRNSTVITSPAAKIEGNENRLLGTFSHEFFHAWNVERIRPRSLEPFNFAQANMSSDLWFAEGFTQYYGELVLKRAGIRTLDAYSNTLAGLVNAVLNTPGAKAFPATRMSRNAVFSDAGVSIDQNNYSNTFTSYYFYGAAIALALDLRLRTEFGKTLDDYMQAVWKVHGKPEVPYTIADLQKVLAGMTNERFAANYFNEYVEGLSKNDYGKLLGAAGLVLRKAAPGKATLGPVRLVADNGRLRLASGTQTGTPAYESGLDIGDYLVRVAGKELKDPADLETILAGYKPGDKINITYESKGTERTASVTLQENSRLEVVPVEMTGGKLTPAMEKLRNNWLSSKIKE